MALCELRWLSPTLNKQVGTFVIIPDNFKPPFAAFYLLHGLSDDYTIWLRRTRIELYAAKYPMVVVMPDGFRGFYTNNATGPNYFDYHTRDLINTIERTFPVKAEQSARCVGGLSMGGYGALRLALGAPGLFTSANSHSGALMAGSRKSPPERFADALQIFGPSPAGTEHDLIQLAARCNADGNLPAIKIDCGTGDFLLNDNREFHQELNRQSISHEYTEYPGGHEWDYWDNHVRDALEFHARALKLTQI